MNQQIEKVKEHIKRNKLEYISGIVGVIVGSAGAYALSKRTGSIQINGTSASMRTKCLYQQNNNLYQTISMYGNVIGRPGKPVFDMETGKRFETETLAAKYAGVSPVMMSNHLNGKRDHVNGRTFKFVTDAS
jgi:hypothetical protein